MALDEIINLTFGSSSKSFPRELKLHIISFYPERWIIEEAYHGEITMGGLKSEALMDQSWTRSNQMYAYNGLKLKYSISHSEGSWYAMGIAESDGDCGMKKGYGSLPAQNGLLDYFYYCSGVEYGFNPDKHRVDGIEKSEEEMKLTYKPERGLYDIVRAKNNGERRNIKYNGPSMNGMDSPSIQQNHYMTHQFELNFSVDECNNSFVSLKIIGREPSFNGRYLIPNRFCVFFGNYYTGNSIQIKVG